MELNPLLTLPGIHTNLNPTFLFASIPANLLYLYVIHVDLIELSCFELHILGWFWVDFYHKGQESG